MSASGCDSHSAENDNGAAIRRASEELDPRARPFDEIVFESAHIVRRWAVDADEANRDA
jgi:hypothetical protein